ncbi:protein EMBRYO DEFECTIVE 1674-like isoform X2 [Amaranthus tricolor]|uniref:protein EMBRYO DEFECTIVE 1674-like isoform X2 n=1 Tax=Amaranthus tricolor TaxID=29722 RepID=UPI00258FCF02|nr:protein EMBRYO DEFECTIVE 1674-like isoform X2 [Amaranthus tricolor]
MEEQAPFSPLIRKIAGEVVAKPKHKTFNRPNLICLVEWWLSKPGVGKGLAVCGRPEEKTRICNDAQRKFHSAPAKRRYASREFHSTKIVKRHGCSTLETSDGFIVSLCGFINKSRSLENGYSTEVCRDFIYGFPYNWEHYATSVPEESSQVNLTDLTKCFPPADLDAYNGAQLHELSLSLSNPERELFCNKVCDDLMELSSLIDENEAQPSKPTRSQVDADVLTSESRNTKVFTFQAGKCECITEVLLEHEDS